MKHLMVMAAGTGGHIFPGLAIADTMRARGWQVSWLGTQRGMEAEIVPRHGLAFDAIDFSGLRGKGLMHTVTGVFKLAAGFVRCRAILRARAPDVVLGMGGYVTVPGGLMAAWLGKPLALMNADAALLMSNKALLPFARKILFGFDAEATAAGGKAQVTGNPVRREISQLPVPVERYRARSGPLNVLIIGGSLGARVLNEIVPAAIAKLPAEQRPRIVHQSGRAHTAALKDSYTQAGIDAEVVDFIDDMAARYAAEFNIPFSGIERFSEQCERVRAACTSIGRDPQSLVYSSALVACIGKNDADIARRAAALGREVEELRLNGLCGTPAEAIERLQKWNAAGAQRMYLQFLDLADLEHLDLVAEEVMPFV
jgi:UDP-N-acetylglucosamine--N-acetylmuramyl-(pentapeptide) pyrophosphoryl-undecaprenol N-acetylglucosamine transferase